MFNKKTQSDNPIVAKAVPVSANSSSMTDAVETVAGVGFQDFDFWAVGPGKFIQIYLTLTRNLN